MAIVKILFICGSPNQTTMMHKISKHFPDCECWFSPYYGDGYIKLLTMAGILDFTILGGKFRKKSLEYIRSNNLQLDDCGRKHHYGLVFTCSDLIMPANILKSKVVLVQEGMTDPENFIYKLVKHFGLPRYFASTSATGLSDLYHMFCVASEGYKNLFLSKGVKKEKIVVTGIPNFDDCKSFLENDFPYKGYVLAATSDSRETYKYENRKKFILKALAIAGGRQIIFKLHPNENAERAVREINRLAPGAIIFSSGNTEPMIANCDVLITRFSTVAYIGLALEKEVHSEFDINELRTLLPLQNGGRSAYNIALAARQLMKVSLAGQQVMLKQKRSRTIIPGKVSRI